jgi:hypothetical protein
MKRIAHLIALALLAASLSPAPLNVNALSPAQEPNFSGLISTVLQTEQPAGAAQPFGLKAALNAPGKVNFRWWSKEPGVVKGLWQVGETNLGVHYTNPASAILAEGPAGAAPAAGQQTAFSIDFDTFVDAPPPPAGKKYYVRLVPLNQNGDPIGIASTSNLIVYAPPPTMSVATVEAGGTFADVYIKASAPVQPSGQAGTKPPGPGDIFANEDLAGPRGAGLLQGYTKNNRVRLLGLKPDTTHHFVVRAEDKNGSVVRVKGQFKTLRQRVTVKFQEVVVVDDSDPTGNAELGISFSVGPRESSYSGIEPTGKKIALNPLKYTFTLINPANPLPVKVLGVDNDESGVFVSLDTCGSVSKECGDWAEKLESFTIYTTGPDEAFTKPFTMKVHGEDLKLDVKGTLTVLYAP